MQATERIGFLLESHWGPSEMAARYVPADMQHDRPSNRVPPDGPERKGRIPMSCLSRAKQIGQSLVVAGALAALPLTTAPTTAFAKGPGVGAAIGLGILGGAIAGAAIASSAPPAYYVAPPAYYYPPQGYYVPPPNYPMQPYYGSASYWYGPYNYQ